MSMDEERAQTLPALPEAEIRDAYERAVGRYMAARRARLPEFIDRNFTFRGSLRLHRSALGWDVVRAPVNIALAVPRLVAMMGAGALDAAGGKGLAARLRNGRWYVPTDLMRELDWRVHTEFLELPLEQPGRRSERDALLEALLDDRAVQSALLPALAALGERAGSEDFRARLREEIDRLGGSRWASAEITTNLIVLASGAAALKSFTPGAVSLGAALAGSIAQAGAIGSFPLGATLGGLYYGVFPATAGVAATAGVTAGLILALAPLTAFAGVAADPVQRRLGLHRRRFATMLDRVEQRLLGREAARGIVADHYVARVLDIVDILQAALRAAT
ncbi:DUF6635 family protein [Oceanibacterium hippocampi]|uniref:Uncharacterized protein n=1 Tax=Oceanibacterium hippocampi TaxID=745714 RepID=A0A1Y5TS34_9PROT|nr:DUF6635 family protein [Oceanibacterium hippocampi]SLN70145.1 hypothetical protein OCH7691_03251 [Oceanibacterium hippocampi]